MSGNFLTIPGDDPIQRRSRDMARYVKKGLRGNWRQEDLQSALRAITNGSKISTAAKEFKVPRRTIKRYLRMKKTVKARLGRRPILQLEQEDELVVRIKRLASVGYPITPKLLRSSVYHFCTLNNIRTPLAIEGKGQVGRDWLAGFMERHPEISLRKSQKLNPARAQKLNKFVVNDYFKKLKQTMDTLGVQNKPGQIYNIDEKGCQLMLHKSPQVLAEKGVKRVHILASEHAENVTIVSCGNALGHAVPPMILFKGKRMKPEWQDNLPPGSLVAMTPKGSMNTETFVKFIEHFANFKAPGPCLLIFDGASSHLDYDIVDVAEKHEITLFCLPSNTTHELQPMDKCVFRAFEHHWDQELQKYWYLNKEKKLTKQRFGLIFSPVWDKALTPSNIKSGFEATGIYPLNPDRIPECAYAPSIPTHLPQADQPEEIFEEETVAQIINTATGLDDDRFSSDDDIPLSLMQGNDREISVCSPIRDKTPPLTPRESRPESSLNSKAIDPLPSTSHCVVQPVPATATATATTSSSVQPMPSTSQDNVRNNISFSDMMTTPEKVSSTKSPRRKAINSLAQQLTKHMFTKKNPAPNTSQQTKTPTAPKTSKQKAPPVTTKNTSSAKPPPEPRSSRQKKTSPAPPPPEPRSSRQRKTSPAPPPPEPRSSRQRKISPAPPSPETGSSRQKKTSPSSSLTDLISAFDTKANSHTQNQKVTAFSGSFDKTIKPTFSKEEYGKPIPGSMTEFRGAEAQARVCTEMKELCEIINQYGKSPCKGLLPPQLQDATKVISFGELFTIYTVISDKLVGILLRTRKHHLTFFEGEVLFQKRDDDVPVFLMMPIADIREYCNNKALQARRSVSPMPN